MLLNLHQKELIRAHPLLSHLKDDLSLDWFMSCMQGQIRRIEGGEILCEAGVKAERVPIVLEGSTQPEMPPFRLWEKIESSSGLSPSIIALVPPETVVAEGECTVLTLKVRTMLKLCNRNCDFHAEFIEKIK